MHAGVQEFIFDTSIYKYGDLSPAFSSFNLEQQGSIVDQWFGGNIGQSGYLPMDEFSSGYRHVLETIQGGFVPLGEHSTCHSVARQMHGQLVVLHSGASGALKVAWVAGPAGKWNEADLTPPGKLAPSTRVAIQHQAGWKQLTAMFVDAAGAICATWVVGYGAWATPLTLTPPGTATPGTPVGMAHLPAE